MERVKDGEEYWYIAFYESVFVPRSIIDGRDWFADGNFRTGNYFHTKAETEAMIARLNAVLKGASVIEMPSKEEILNVAMQKFNNEDDSARDVLDFQIGCEWLKSKIVK